MKEIDCCPKKRAICWKFYQEYLYKRNVNIKFKHHNHNFSDQYNSEHVWLTTYHIYQMFLLTKLTKPTNNVHNIAIDEINITHLFISPYSKL